jgi:D-glycero-beta-D-manno-heptose-7-phosphate kinase
VSATRPARRDLLRAIDGLAGVRIVVIADLVLDEFEYGAIDRVSREAPVLILNHVRTDRLPGGGANAVHNIRALDGEPLVIGRVGRDEPGERLLALLRERGIETGAIWIDAAYHTPVKRRVLAGSAHSVKQQIVRVDRGGGPPVDPATAPLLGTLRSLAGRGAGALISDYSFGLLNPATIPPVLDLLRASRLRLFVDSRGSLARYRGLTAATPNLQEAEALLGEPAGDEPDRLDRAGALLRERLDAEALVVTRGSEGMSVFETGSRPVHLGVYGTDEVADVTGAGDTVISIFSLAVLSGCPYLTAAVLANYAGGLVVMKRGTATVSRAELRRAVETDSTPGAGAGGS